MCLNFQTLELKIDKDYLKIDCANKLKIIKNEKRLLVEERLKTLV